LRGVARLAAVVAAALVLAAPAAAREVIERFAAAIEVRRDGALEVTETIRARVEGTEIRRGIVRDFPLRHGDGRRVSFEVTEVRRGGEPVPYTVEREGGWAHVRIGDPDLTLPAPSTQTWTLRYRTAGQLRRFEGFDELYWNVTGDAWTFPIEAAEVAIALPAGTEIRQFAAYTGPPGAQGEAFEVTAADEGVFRARTTAPLAPGEGFTVAVGWPAGVVAGIGALTGPTLVGVPVLPLSLGGGVAAGLAFCLSLWWRHGRDPRAGAPYPRFAPPGDLSPAACRYLRRRRVDGRALTAAIVGLAVKGVLRIEDRGDGGGGRFRLEATGAEAPLTADERALRDALFGAGPQLELGRDGGAAAVLRRARTALKRALAASFADSFTRNHRTAQLGLAVAAALAVFAVLLPYRGHGETLVVYLFGLAWTTLAVFMATQLAGKAVAAGRPRGAVLAAIPLAMAVVAPVGMLVGEGTALYGAGALEAGTLILAGGVLGAILGRFRDAMASPTAAGRARLDEVDGLALYLAVAEAERLEALHPPERTPERFEALLPYAIALDLVESWAAQFKGALAPTQPRWYRGRRLEPGGLAQRLDRDLARAVAAGGPRGGRRGGAGSGGGGASGGGGGGGGGSGW